MTDWRELREPWERLRWARMRAGFERAKDAADSLGMKPITYRTYEREPGRAGARGFDHQIAVRLAKKFKVSWTWLLRGEGDPDAEANTTLEALGGEIISRLSSISDEAQRDKAAELIRSVLDTYARKSA